MKNLLTAFILGIALAGVSLAQTSAVEKTSKRQPGKAVEVKLAVIEFSPGANASGMTAEAKRQLQTTLAAELANSKQFDVADIRWTRNESQNDLANLNGSSSTAAAVKLGKKLGVSYVLTGNVTEYTPKGADDFGRAVLKTRLIEVATGKVKFTGETTQQSASAMRTNGVAEMQAKVMKYAVEKLAETLAGLKF